MNYLEIKGEMPAPKINTIESTVVDIDFSKTSKSAFTTTISAIVKGVPAKFNGAVAFTKLNKGELKLVKFSISNTKMEEAANKSPKVLENLIHYGKNARIAHQIFVVMDAKLATEFDNNVSGDLAVGKGGLEVTVGGNGGASGKTTVSISSGTGFAYLMVSIDWNALQKKNKSKIVDLDIDQWSFS